MDNETKKDETIVEDEKDLDITTEDDKPIEDDKTGADDKDKSDKKPESLEDREARLERQLKQTRKKLGKDVDEPKDKSSKSKSNVLDRADKAFLVASGIKGSKEFALVQEIMSETGKDIDSILESKHFQAELKELREETEAKDATIKGSKRSGSSDSGSVEYWLAKGELPPNSPENQKLRQEVVNARVKKTSGGSNFTSTPVA